MFTWTHGIIAVFNVAPKRKHKNIKKNWTLLVIRETCYSWVLKIRAFENFQIGSLSKNKKN